MAGSIHPYQTKAGTRYRVRYRKPDGAQTDKRGFTTKRDAKLFLATIDVKKSEGLYVDPARGRATINELGTRWVAGQTHLKPSTMHVIESTWRIHVNPEWGTRAASSIDHSEIQAWVTRLSKGTAKTKPKSATTVKRAHGILSGILESAALDRRIPANPAKGIKLPRGGRRERAYLTHEQVEALAAACGTHAPLIRFLAYTGLRWGEATGLHVSDVDFIRARVSVTRNAVNVAGKIIVGTPKTHRERWVPFPEFLRPDLSAAIAGKEREQILFGDGSTHVISPSSQAGWFSVAVRSCRSTDKTFPHITPHDLRHTTASLAIAAGANVKAVQRMLGHASAAMTLDVYADLFDDDLASVATALDAARSGVA